MGFFGGCVRVHASGDFESQLLSPGESDRLAIFTGRWLFLAIFTGGLTAGTRE